ncbi:NUDIX hydrolase [Solicola sp. PLA-1-18]|uniref:NUDIX hydrolase n=1 Tax=Solicola sp. PLA-1-18 TaxID=3380532 RepID=UPI003B817B6D
MPRVPAIQAAGAVVWRREPGTAKADHRVEVLVIHRPKYDDWSLPKGKVDPGEVLPGTAVREVEEETGLRVRLGVRLNGTTYTLRTGGTKQVHWWTARPVGGIDPVDYEPNHEVDEVRWATLDVAAALMTWDRDRDVLADFALTVYAREHRARPLLLVRHAEARPRKRWRGDDLARPLTPAGEAWARRLPALVDAFAAEVALTSPAARCTSTIAPWARASGVHPIADDRIAESDRAGGAPSSRLAGEVVGDLLGSSERTLVCTHRPVLPPLYDALGLRGLGTITPGSAVVVHHRHGRVLGQETFTAS